MSALAFRDPSSGRKGKAKEAEMASSSTSEIDLAWVQQLEDYVQAELRSRASRDVNALQDQHMTFGQHAADVLAAKAGSWTFILSFVGVLVLWIAVNTIVLTRHWDPCPFILLNLVLSCLAAIQAPVIMMSQQRQATRDRLQADTDYRVNVKAEILLEHLTKEVEEIKLYLAPATHAGATPDAASQASSSSSCRRGSRQHARRHSRRWCRPMRTSSSSPRLGRRRSPRAPPKGRGPQ